eukprot:842350-Rhodomonas_salina.2
MIFSSRSISVGIPTAAKVCSELRDLGEPYDEKRDVKRAQEAIFAFALRDGATPYEATWADWLRSHRRLMVIEKKAGLTPINRNRTQLLRHR